MNERGSSPFSLSEPRSRRRLLRDLGGWGALALAASLVPRRDAWAEPVAAGGPRIDSVEAIPVRLWARPDPPDPRFESGFDWPSEAPGFGGEVAEELVRAHARR